MMTHSVDLPVTIPEEFVPDFLGKLHYVSEDLDGFRLQEGHRDRVVFQTRAGREVQASTIAQRIREVANKMYAGHRGFEARVLHSHRLADMPFQNDPRPLLEKRGQLFE